MLFNKEKSFYLLSKKCLSSLKLLNDDISIKIQDLNYISTYLKKQTYLLITATAIDQIDKFNRFCLSYVFITYILAHRIYVIYNTNMKAPSITHIFSSAIWLEREIYDLFGVFFSNNSSTNDLRRILTDYHFKGHPFCKNYALIGYSEKIFSFRTKTIKTKREVIF